MSSTVQVYPAPPWARPTIEAEPMLPEPAALPFLLKTRFELIEQAGADSLETGLVLDKVLAELESGELRIAEPDGESWIVNGWLRRALLLLASRGRVTPVPGPFAGTEISTLGWRPAPPPETRVPPGSFLRRGSYLAPGTSIMPPSTVQSGAWIGPRTVIDSHVLIGSCAQIAGDSIIGPGTIVGGVLMPEEVCPVILARGVVLGGNSSLFGSMILGEEAHLHMGTQLNAAIGLYDAVRDCWIEAGPDGCLRVPSGSEVAMGLPPQKIGQKGPPRLAPILLGYHNAGAGGTSPA